MHIYTNIIWKHNSTSSVWESFFHVTNVKKNNKKPPQKNQKTYDIKSNSTSYMTSFQV